MPKCYFNKVAPLVGCFFQKDLTIQYLEVPNCNGKTYKKNCFQTKAEMYLGHYETTMMELFCEIS